MLVNPGKFIYENIISTNYIISYSQIFYKSKYGAIRYIHVPNAAYVTEAKSPTL